MTDRETKKLLRRISYTLGLLVILVGFRVTLVSPETARYNSLTSLFLIVTLIVLVSMHLALVYWVWTDKTSLD